jgi:hypothetical protein
MTDQPGLTPPPPTSDPTGPAWGTAEPPDPAEPPWQAYAPPAAPAYGVPVAYQQTTGQETHQGGLWSMILGIAGLAIAGWIMGLVGILIAVLAVLVVVAIVALIIGIFASAEQ